MLGKIRRVYLKKRSFQKRRFYKPENRKECIKISPKCQICGVSKNISAHHIIFKSDYLDDHLENLISLCWNCHRHAHDGIWIQRKDKTEYISARDFMIQALEFLNLKRYVKAIEELKKKP